MPARSFSWQGSAYIHQCRIDVVAGFSIHRDEEGQAAVQRQDIHAPILVMVPGQEADAAVLGPDTRRHDVEGLRGQGQIGRYCLDGCPEQRRQQCSHSLHPPSLPLQSFPQDCSLPWRCSVISCWLLQALGAESLCPGLGDTTTGPRLQGRYTVMRALTQALNTCPSFELSYSSPPSCTKWWASQEVIRWGVGAGNP